MKNVFKPTALSLVLGVLAFSGQAIADQVTADYTGMSATLGITYSVVLPPGSGTTPKTGGTSAGIFNFDQGSSTRTDFKFFDTDQFVSFCIDLEDTIATTDSPVTWDIVSLSGAPDADAGPMGTTKAEDIGQVLTYVLTGINNEGGIDSTVLNDARLLKDFEIRALQTVIWEIVHENPVNSYDLALGDATFVGLGDPTDPTKRAAAFAVQILANFEGSDAMAGLVGLTSSSTQDFIGQVPIPAAAWLFGSALMGTVALGRRKQRQKKLAA